MLVIALVFSLSACSSEKTVESDWDIPIEDIEWGMTAEEVASILNLDSYELVASESNDTIRTLYISGDINSILDVTLSSVEFIFEDSNQYIDGYTGLTSFVAACNEDDKDTVKDCFTELYGDCPKDETAMFSYTWSSNSVETLENSDAVIAQLEESFREKGIDENYIETFLVSYKNESLVTIYFSDRDNETGIIVMNASNKVLSQVLLEKIEN